MACDSEKCTACNPGYGLASASNECVQCSVQNCDACDSENLNKCLSCHLGYNLADDGSCNPVSGTADIQLSSVLRYDMTMEDYNGDGGDANFVSETSAALEVPTTSITVSDVSVGSVIIKFKIKSSGGSSLAEKEDELKQIKAKLDAAVKSGAMKIYSGATILNYESGIVIVSKSFYSCEQLSDL